MHVEIKIGRKKDEKPLFPEIKEAGFEEGVLESVGILEAGMISGKASLWLNLRMPDGRYACAQVSADIFEMLAGALRGAVARFQEFPG